MTAGADNNEDDGKGKWFTETILFNIQLKITCDIRTGRRIKSKGKTIAIAVSVKISTLRAASFRSECGIGSDSKSSFCKDEVMMQD